MRDDLPPLPLYAPVLARLGDRYRRSGGGWNFRCPFGGRHKNGDANPSAFVRVNDDGTLRCHCNGCGAKWPEFVEFVGLPVGAWFPDLGQKGKWRLDAPEVKSRVAGKYPYRDRHGQLLATKLRWEPGFHGEAKTFSWERPITDPALRELLAAQGVPKDAEAWATSVAAGTYRGAAKNGRWKFRKDAEHGPAVDLPGVAVGPYRLPEVLAADKDQPTFCVEGEGKADLLASLGFVATSGPAGKGKWELGWGDIFEGRRVVVIPDRDHPDALTFGEKVAASALFFDCESVRVVRIPFDELPKQGRSKDIKDWLELRFPGGKGTAPGKRQAVVDLCKRFPEYRRA